MIEMTTRVNTLTSQDAVHVLQALGHPTRYGRVAATTLCGKRTTGHPGLAPSRDVTCPTCRKAAER